MEFLRKFWFHILAWGAMSLYFLFAPDLFTFVFIKNGKPLQTDNVIPVESDQIKFVIDGMESYAEDGEKLFKIYGWALITPDGDTATDYFAQEVVLISAERKYFFPVKSEYRNPDLPNTLADAGVDLNKLGFSLLIAEDVIKPGKYRLGIIFRDISTGSAVYWDKPAYHLVKTPNTLRLEKK